MFSQNNNILHESLETELPIAIGAKILNLGKGLIVTVYLKSVWKSLF